ncbi:hypothetical protein [Pedobacter hiemivivus]|uniref:Uncharacterized protein n=1 Tax=Pedobacter hiemivivus TaxID=2530454 RepID=A0A4R0M8Z9_9SPHI|nr:hypothetical protein [Pedobacter hiemivivus]TCC82690.1 hypothetical protein EZ444_26460 [Pedobacter hiemivivus]
MITTFKLDKSKRSMLSIFTYMGIIILLASCKKGNPVEVKSYSFLEVEIVALPGTPYTGSLPGKFKTGRFTQVWRYGRPWRKAYWSSFR